MGEGTIRPISTDRTGKAPPTSTGALGRRPVGRPRSSGASANGSVRDTIVAVATEMFATQGYAATSMKAIAEAAGLRQPSVYYWFSTKDELIRASLGLGRSAVLFLEELATQPGSVAVKLFRFLRVDMSALCTAPYEYNEIERAAEARPEEFAAFWSGYGEMQRLLAALIDSGVASGEFRSVPSELTSIVLLAANEGAQKRFRHQLAHATDTGHPFRYDAHEMGEYIDVVATAGVRSVLAERSQTDLDEIVTAANVLDRAN